MVVSSESLYVPLPTVLLQVVSEDKLYPEEVRQQAALVASKVGLVVTTTALMMEMVYIKLG